MKTCTTIKIVPAGTPTADNPTVLNAMFWLAKGIQNVQFK